MVGVRCHQKRNLVALAASVHFASSGTVRPALHEACLRSQIKTPGCAETLLLPSASETLATCGTYEPHAVVGRIPNSPPNDCLLLAARLFFFGWGAFLATSQGTRPCAVLLGASRLRSDLRGGAVLNVLSGLFAEARSAPLRRGGGGGCSACASLKEGEDFPLGREGAQGVKIGR